MSDSKLEVLENTAEAFEEMMSALSVALDGDDMYAQSPAELVWRLRDQRDEALMWFKVDPQTVPKPGSKVLAHYLNGLGKSRIVVAAVYTADIIAEEWEESDAPPGWYEMADGAEDCWQIGEEVTHWRPLPSPPVLP